ncbi:MAG: Na+/H+ antiporter subunit E [Pseudomonadota bacterium]
MNAHDFAAFDSGSALRRAAFLALIWWALAGGAPDWAFGAPFIAAALAASLISAPRRQRLRLAGLAQFAPFFFWESLRGGVDVARRALHPRRPLAPALVTHRLRLPSGAARVFLTNVVSLLPGTLSAELAEDELRLHVLDARLDASVMLRRVEARIAALLGVTLETRAGDIHD